MSAANRRRIVVLALILALPAVFAGTTSAKRNDSRGSRAEPVRRARTDSLRHLFIVRFMYGRGTPDNVSDAADQNDVESGIVAREWSSLPRESMELLAMSKFLETHPGADTLQPCEELDRCDVVEVREGPIVDHQGNPGGIWLKLRIGPARPKSPPDHPDGAPAPGDTTRSQFKCNYPLLTVENFQQCRMTYAGKMKNSVTAHFAAHRSHP